MKATRKRRATETAIAWMLDKKTEDLKADLVRMRLAMEAKEGQKARKRKDKENLLRLKAKWMEMAKDKIVKNKQENERLMADLKRTKKESEELKAELNGTGGGIEDERDEVPLDRIPMEETEMTPENEPLSEEFRLMDRAMEEQTTMERGKEAEVRR